MFARSTTFNGRPASIDAGIKFIKDEAAPMLDSIEGCRGLSLMVDRNSGQCIATSSWSNEDSMRLSDPQLRALRDRGRDILGGGMQIDEWEIAVMHRSAHGETCRASWMSGNLDQMIDTFRFGIMPPLQDIQGFCSASMLVNRSSGLACVTTCWETREAMVASRDQANSLRAQAAQESTGEVVDVHEYELAYAHLHVPELV